MKKEYKGFMPGDKILIKKINDKRKDLEGKEAVIQFIDDAGQLHIDITSVALIPGIDEIKLIAGTRNGNMIFACSLSKTGYITFRRTTYTCDGTPAIVYYKTDASGSIQICDSGVLTVNLSDYGCFFRPNMIVIHHDMLHIADEIVNIFRNNFTDGNSWPVRYGYASSIIVQLDDDYTKKIGEVK